MRKLVVVIGLLLVPTAACLDAGDSGTRLPDPMARQGFFDIAVDAAPPADVEDLCFAMRVVNELGEGIWSEARVCSSEHGNGRGGDVTFVHVCDATTATNTITLWVHEPANTLPGDPGQPARWNNPCPAPTIGGDPFDWSGGCVRAAPCSENMDTLVRFDFESSPR